MKRLNELLNKADEGVGFALWKHSQDVHISHRFPRKFRATLVITADIEDAIYEVYETGRLQ